MKKAIFAAIAILPLAVQAQKPFGVSGNVKGLKTGDKVYLAYQAEGKDLLDSGVVENGAFAFKGQVASPVRANLMVNKNPLIYKLKPGHDADFLSLYLEPASIKINGSDSLKHAEISGSIVNADDKRLKASIKHLTDKLEALSLQYAKMSDEDKRNEALVTPLREKFNEASLALAPLHLDFAKNNPNSYISLVAVAQLSADPEFITDAEKAYSGLNLNLKVTKLGTKLDQLFASGRVTAIGAVAPDFTQNDVNDKPVKLSDFRGKYVLLDFWASWCGPCRAENPNVLAAYNKYKDKNFTVLGVSLDNPGKKDAWLAAINKDGLPWTQVSDLKGWANEAAAMYGVRSIPASFLLDPSGKIVAKNLRGEDLNKKLEELLGGSASK